MRYGTWGGSRICAVDGDPEIRKIDRFLSIRPLISKITKVMRSVHVLDDAVGSRLP